MEETGRKKKSLDNDKLHNLCRSLNTVWAVKQITVH